MARRRSYKRSYRGRGRGRRRNKNHSMLHAFSNLIGCLDIITKFCNSR
jgi:hypothetical protein